MSETQISLRLPAEMLKRAESMIDRLALDANVAAAVGTVNRSTVLRVALARGLDVLATELPAPATKRRKR